MTHHPADWPAGNVCGADVTDVKLSDLGAARNVKSQEDYTYVATTDHTPLDAPGGAQRRRTFPIFLPHFRLYKVASLHTCVLPYKYRNVLGMSFSRTNRTCLAPGYSAFVPPMFPYHIFCSMK